MLKIASKLYFRVCVYKSTFSAATQNLALGKTVYQISTAGRFSAEKAVDGDANGNFERGSCTHTIDGRNPWWAVDLDKLTVVTHVKITNRLDCCGK